MKFIAYAKLSKSRRRAADKVKRGSWGQIKPVTKVKPSGKIYSRRKNKQDLRNAYSSNPVFLFAALAVDCMPAILSKTSSVAPTSYLHRERRNFSVSTSCSEASR